MQQHSNNNDDELYTNLLSLFNLLKPAQWPTLLLEGEEHLSNSATSYNLISVNDFQDLWDERDLQNTQIPYAVKDARKIRKAVTDH